MAPEQDSVSSVAPLARPSQLTRESPLGAACGRPALPDAPSPFPSRNPRRFSANSLFSPVAEPSPHGRTRDPARPGAPSPVPGRHPAAPLPLPRRDHFRPSRRPPGHRDATSHRETPRAHAPCRSVGRGGVALRGGGTLPAPRARGGLAVSPPLARVI